MYSVSEISKLTGIARSTLLYYERIHLINPKRDNENGYRDYSEKDLHKLILLKQFQKAGFSLSDCKRILEGDYNAELIKEKFYDLEKNIAEIKMAGDFLKSIYRHLTDTVLEQHSVYASGKWHSEFEKISADAHFKWLQEIGLSKKDAMYVRWVSRDIGNNKTYMKYFFKVFEKMKRQGPGSRSSTLRSFKKIPGYKKSERILEIGCGKGNTALTLLKESHAEITAIDNHQPFLDHFKRKADLSGFSNRIKVFNMDMHNLEFKNKSFDLIWSEGSAYFIGFEEALRKWKRFLSEGGYLFISDAIWLTDNPSALCREYWEKEYPAMTDQMKRISQAQKSGYEIVDCFTLPRKDWKSFYDDMEKNLNKAIKRFGMNKTFSDMKDEIEVDRKFGSEYSYICLLLKKIK